ncbi:MAG TPA: hypothetical protein P5338_03990 [Bacteroidales bacterium]|nr:hypothetical protein [Bacteroidales bacterium]
MQVNILYILLFVFVACGPGSEAKYHTPEKDPVQTKINNREINDRTIFEGDTLNGKIKTIIENCCEEWCDGSDIIYTFNEYGLQVRRQGLGQDILKYYDGHKLKKSCICFADNGKEYRRNEYVYDGKGNLITQIHIILPNARSRFPDSTIRHFSYNSKNKLIEEREGGKAIKYQYDEFDDCIVEELFTRAIVLKRLEYKYINHRLEEKLSWEWFEGKRYFKRETYSYNPDGTLKCVIHNSSSTKELLKGNNAKTFYYYTYNDENRLVKIKEIENQYNKTITYSDFDKKGNWQVKTISENGRNSTTKRRFEYFHD